MRIVITGGSGRLGRPTVARLLAAGHSVLSVDSSPSPVAGAEWRVADLRRRESAYDFLRDAEVVIHLGNHSNAMHTDAQTLLAENTAMNVNVCQAAAELGVRRIIFSSSVQAISGGPVLPQNEYPAPTARRLPALPVDGATPPRAGNAYGLSKIFGEQLVAHHAHHHGGEGVAIRFPSLLPGTYPFRLPYQRPDSERLQAELYGWLWLDDAARLLELCATKPLPGFRIYHPAGPLPPDWPDAGTLARTHLADAPRRDPARPLETLFDLSDMVRDLGWHPTPFAQIPG
jgi:nucleoside-diphosphate-sugar epimerase